MIELNLPVLPDDCRHCHYFEAAPSPTTTGLVAYVTFSAAVSSALVLGVAA